MNSSWGGGGGVKIHKEIRVKENVMNVMERLRNKARAAGDDED